MLSGIIAILTAGALVSGQAMSAAEDAREVTVARGRVFLPVWLEGVGPYPFLLDTAAPYVALDTPIANTLGLAESGEPERLGNVHAQPVRIQALETANRPAIACEAFATDLSPMEAAYGLRVAGILGLPGLPSRFRLDCERRRIVRFPAEMGPEWIAVPLKVEPDGVMRVQLTVDNKHTLDAIVDTAFGGNLAIPQGFLERWGLLPEAGPRLRAADAGAVEGVTQIRLARCSVGNIAVVTPLCDVAGNDTAPRLGLRFLSRFELALDRDAETLHVRPLVPLPWTDPPLYSAGVTPGERVEDLWSLFVAEDSPAAMAGILPGDLLVSVNGLEMAGQSFDFVQRALTGKPATVLDIAVLRAEGILVFRVAVEEAL